MSTENEDYKWVTIDGTITGCMLLNSIYNGVVVEFGETRLEDTSFTFDWSILDSNGVEGLGEDAVLDKYLESIVYDRLCRMGIYEREDDNEPEREDNS